MGHIVLLALAAAVFPTLIACVAIMISRPEPRGLLLGFYLGGVIASVTSGIVVLAAFNDGNAVLGSTTSSPSPGTSIVAGLLSLLLACLWLQAAAMRCWIGGAAAILAVQRRRRDLRGPSAT